jgi:branched-chain amino acid aminotransferase
MFAKKAMAVARAAVTSAKVTPLVRSLATIEPKSMIVERTKNPKPKTPKEKLLFGVTKSDHMLEIDWSLKDGWTAPRIVPYHNLELDPACSALHYGLEVRFIGLESSRCDG